MYNYLICIRNFVEVVKHSSFSKAARELGINTSQLSKQVRWLELENKSVFLERTKKKVLLTKAGEVFFLHCQRVLADVKNMRECFDSLSDEPSGKIKFSIPLALMISPLMNIITSFLKDYPKISMELYVANSVAKIVDGDYDMIVSAIEYHDKQVIKVPFCSLECKLFASPEYIKKKGNPKNINDLESHYLISNRRMKGPSHTLTFLDNTKVKMPCRYTTDSNLLNIHAAKKSLGIFAASYTELYEEVSNKNLVLIDVGKKLPDISTYIYHRPVNSTSPVAIFVSYLCEHIKDLVNKVPGMSLLPQD
ncbi:LysR family transcriptional regulator [Francisella sp. 19X1-34]|uniref:LysR family transcriptional regulator n=1 Tax=Francisella sp. 19X1-34 TaxID=3087177 RepID=UPI002E31FF29|nr:LysR family transcriptional regulator [Francisella sp. 19X1-34]MED7787608.1 LysR family transcriptional regulator [Francisella sp. 19X1-34]